MRHFLFLIAVAYIILPDKQQPSYLVVFDKLKELSLINTKNSGHSHQLQPFLYRSYK